MFPGGIAAKLGNQYERKWAVRKLFEVIADRATSIRYEGVTEDFRGFEFALRRPDYVEWHQTKINAPSGNWTLYRLKQEGVMDAFKRRLSGDGASRCVFVSADPASQMRKLCDKARMANDANEFLDVFSEEDKETFDELAKLWDVDEGNVFEFLRRSEFRTESVQAMDEAIDMYGRHLLRGEADIFACLSNYLLNNLNALITTEVARAWVRNSSPFMFRPAALDPTLSEKFNSANRRYLDSYQPVGIAGRQIPRAEADAVLVELQAADGPSLILLTGEAGSGKSGVVREVMSGLRASVIPHLTFRVDRYLSCRTRNDVGSFVLDCDESPVSVLANLAGGNFSVLIVDQIDAVSESSGRTGTVKDILLELVRETRHYGDVRCLLVCRSFDLENDPQYRELERNHQAKQIQVTPLAWERHVVPILEHAGVATESLTDGQRRLLSLPINLSVFIDIGDPVFGFTTSTELMQRLLQKKIQDLQRARNVRWSVQGPLYAMAEWMSDKQELSCPDSVLDDFDCARDLLSSEGLIVVEQHRLAFFHESFFDFVFARNFARFGRDIADFLTSTEQHLFRRTQVRQILTSMRDTDRRRYLEALETVLTDPRIRLHIKHAVAQWLASVDDVTLGELEIILGLDDEGEEFPVLIRKALFVSESWFDLLNDAGYISNMLRTAEGPRLPTLLVWLGNIADKRLGPVVTLLDNWLNDDPECNQQLIRWFGSVHPMPADRALTALLRDVIRSGPGNLFLEGRWRRVVGLLSGLCELHPVACSEILRTLFAKWFENNPGKHPFSLHEAREINTHDLAELAQKAPAVFLDGMIPALVKSVQIALNKNSSGYGILFLYDTGAERGLHELFPLYRDAFRKLAETSPAETETFLGQLDPTLHQVLLYLYLETIRANPSALNPDYSWDMLIRASNPMFSCGRCPVSLEPLSIRLNRLKNRTIESAINRIPARGTVTRRQIDSPVRNSHRFAPFHGPDSSSVHYPGAQDTRASLCHNRFQSVAP